MASLAVSFHSETLRKACSMNVILPDRGAFEPPYPVLYLLHGLGDDHTIWSRRTSIERYVQDVPLIVVMPDGQRSFYCDAVTGPKFETYVVRDVIGFVDRFFHTIASREGRAIGGLSMGGYGALKFGFKFPELFCTVHAHSGAVGITRRTVDNVREDIRVDFPLVFGDAPEGGKDCLFGLASRANPGILPAMRIDCGVDDGLIGDNRDLHAHFEAFEIPHEYQEFPGVHDWAYWDTHIQEAIAFHRRTFAI